MGKTDSAGGKDEEKIPAAHVKTKSKGGVKSEPPASGDAWTTPKVVGDTIPSVIFKTRARIEKSGDDENPFDWKDVTTEELFKDKRIVLFSLPGAFTPVCSASMLPGYEAKYEDIKKLGVDDVYCLSVNDAFVMRQWGIHQGLEEDKTPGSLGFTKVKLLPDGTAHFTRGMGYSCTWDSERGFGERSWRYSMVIENMKIEKVFVEKDLTQNDAEDPFKETSAETMLTYLTENKK